MSDVLTFWDKTIETISLEIKETQILNGGQQTNKIKNVFKFTQKTMETLSIYEKQF